MAGSGTAIRWARRCPGARAEHHEGIGEGQGQLIQVNRYLYDPGGSGSYRIPDVSIPGANQIYDATLGFKSWSTP